MFKLFAVSVAEVALTFLARGALTSLDVSHAPGELLYTDYLKCPVVDVRKRISGMTQASV